VTAASNQRLEDMSMRGIEGKIAIVTGAGSGMGKATALRLAEEGATVLAADVTGAENVTASEMPVSISGVHCDVTSSADVRGLVGQAINRHGRLDVMCNVVGVAGIAQGLLADIDEDEFDQIVSVNLKSCFLGMKYAIPAMIQGGGGSIINWSSTGALSGSGTTGPYSCTKAGVLSLTRAAARGYGPQNVRVNAVCPGFTYPTGMTLMGEERFPELVKQRVAKAALNRPAHPNDIAGAVAFLASDDGAYLTGTYLLVDGGMLAGD
jgi:NAD(P)-dependent dehydrogenase (short-subunit alcohol dehydrogenase family)